MNIPQLLLCCFLPGALCGAPVFTKTRGETLTFGCSFDSPQGSRFFTKTELQKENVLVETSGVRARRGRHSIGYEADIFYVSIAQLNESDSGHYSCGLGNSSSPGLLREFELRVTPSMCSVNSPGVTVCSEAEQGSVRVSCSLASAGLFGLFFCKDECKKQDVLIETDGSRAQRGRYRIEYEKNGAFHVTIVNLTKSDAGLYRCGVNTPSAPNPCHAVEIRVTDAPATSEPTSTLLPSLPAGSPSPPTAHRSGSCSPSTAFPPITTLSAVTYPLQPTSLFEPHTEDTTSKGYSGPLVLCLSVAAVLLAVLLVLLLSRRMKRSRSNAADLPGSDNMECATF